MKKMFYLVFFLMGITFSVFAQGTIVLADYEPGSSYPDRTFAWNGANLTTGFANPLKAGINTSDGVAEFHITSQWSDAVYMNNFDESISLALRPIVKLKIYSASQVGKSINLQVTDINGFSQNISQTLSGTVNSAWEEVTFDFSNIAKSTSISFIKELTIKIDYGNAPPSPDTDNKYYLDDISFNGPAISMSESDIMTLYNESFSGNPWWGTPAENTLNFFRSAQWGGSALTASASFYNGSELLRMEMVDGSIAVAELFPSSVRTDYSFLNIKDIDISGLGNFTLQYSLRWKGTPTSFTESPTIEYSVDGGSWVSAGTSSTLPVATNVWTPLEYSLSLATGSVMKIRINNYTSANFLIDEIVLKGNPVFVSDITVSTPGNVSKILTKNGTLQISAEVLPTNANQKVLWTVIPGTGNATISNTGLLTSVSNGTVQVKARALDVWGSVTDTKDITISAADSIEFTADASEITSISATVNTDVAFYPIDVTQSVTYTSGNSEVATIDASGDISPVSNGNLWFYATSEGGIHKDSLYLVVDIQLDSIVFTADSYEIITIGGEVNSHVAFHPLMAAQNVNYTSGDTEVATISASGLIKAVSNGDIWIYAVSEDGTRKDSLNLVVNIPYGSIDFNADSYEINSLDTEVATDITFYPSISAQNLVFTSGDSGIAAINESGVITPVTNGEVWLYAETEDGIHHDSINMVVDIPVESIDFTADAYEITTIGATVNTQVAFTPYFTVQGVTYTSGNQDIATIDVSGVISPVANGEVWLYAETEDETQSDSVLMDVNIPTLSIDFTAAASVITSMGTVVNTQVSFTPSMATREMIYTSGNPYVAVINESGVISPVANGKVRLYAETIDGNHIDSIDMVVSIGITSIDFVTYKVGITSFDEKLSTIVNFNPAFMSTEIIYSSGNPEIATIDESGIISPVSNGDVWLYATTEDGYHYDRVFIVVDVPTDSIDFTAEANEIRTINGTVNTHTTFYPNGAVQKMDYISGDQAIATIDDSGVIKAVSNGEVWLYATTEDGSLRDSSKIVVNIPENVLLIADYEPNSLLPDRTTAWNNSNLNIDFENPLKEGENISDGVAAFHITSQYGDAVVLNNFEESISLAQHPIVMLKILSDSAVAKTINLEVTDINGFTQNINQTLSQNVNTKWELVTFDFSEIVKNSPISFINSITIKIDYGTLASGNNIHNKYYLDDILFSGRPVDLAESDILTLFTESFSGNPWWMSMPREKAIADFRTASWGGSALTANAKYYNATDSLKMEMVDWAIGVPEFYPSTVRPTLSSLLVKDINISGFANFSLKYDLRWKDMPVLFTQVPTLEYSVDGSDWTTLETTSTLPDGVGVWKTLSYQINSVSGSTLTLRITNNASANLFVDEIILKGNPLFVSNIAVSTEGDNYEITTPQGTLQMLANVLPADANQNVLWSVISETGSATISVDGVLKAVSDGTVLVKARALDANGTISGTREITISNQMNAVESMDFTADASEIASMVGKINTQVTFSSGATGQNVIYTSNNSGIATINESGVISPVTNGEVWVFAELEDGSLKDSLSILVNISVESIDFTADASEITSLEDVVNTHVVFTPGFTSETVIYTSGDTGIATINASGVISPVANGEVWLYAETADGNHIDSLSIVVNTTVTDVNLAGHEVNCKIYPNPANDYITISSSLSIKTVRIYNLASQIVRIIEVNSVSKLLNVNELHSGIYMLLIETERGSLVKKLVKR